MSTPTLGFILKSVSKSLLKKPLRIWHLKHKICFNRFLKGIVICITIFFAGTLFFLSTFGLFQVFHLNSLWWISDWIFLPENTAKIKHSIPVLILGYANILIGFGITLSFLNQVRHKKRKFSYPMGFHFLENIKQMHFIWKGLLVVAVTCSFLTLYTLTLFVLLGYGIIYVLKLPFKVAPYLQKKKDNFLKNNPEVFENWSIKEKEKLNKNLPNGQSFKKLKRL